jgi:hypothetical protein
MSLLSGLRRSTMINAGFGLHELAIGAALNEGCPHPYENLKTSNIFLEFMVVFEAWRAGAS